MMSRAQEPYICAWLSSTFLEDYQETLAEFRLVEISSLPVYVEEQVPKEQPRRPTSRIDKIEVPNS
jgi:hypothetical protein